MATKKSTSTKKSASAPKKSTAKSAKTPAKKAAPKKNTTKKAAPKKQPVQEQKPLFHKKTIAERTVAFKTRNWPAVIGWIAIVLFCLLALFFFYCMVGYDFSGLVCLAIAGIILVYKGLHLLGKKYPRDARIITRIFSCILCIGFFIVAATEVIIVDASFGSPKEHCDYMVVLGAGVRGNVPSLSLRNRIDATYDYLTAHPDVIAVLSGGQGEGEDMTEAQCMFDHLTQMGIDESRLWMEDRATSTWENLNFSLDLIEERTGQRPEKLGVLSSEYHLFRASLFADACGVDFVGVPAKTTKISLRINYFMREVAGVWHYLLLGGQYDA